MKTINPVRIIKNRRKAQAALLHEIQCERARIRSMIVYHEWMSDYSRRRAAAGLPFEM